MNIFVLFSKLIVLSIVWFKNRANRIVRFFYWIYRLSLSDIGQGVSICFPLSLEGRGRLAIGAKSKISKNVQLGVGESGMLTLGVENRLDDSVRIFVGNGQSLITASKVKISAGSILYVQNNWEFGYGCTIATHCSIFSRESGCKGRLRLGKHVAIGDYTILDLSDDIIIGDDVALGAYCILYTHDHDYKSSEDCRWKGKVKTGVISIGSGAWIGARVSILPGVAIGKSAVVATGAVVTKDVPEGAVVAGVPAKILNAKKLPLIK